MLRVLRSITKTWITNRKGLMAGSNLANLLREMNVYVLAGNDAGMERIQALIDKDLADKEISEEEDE